MINEDSNNDDCNIEICRAENNFSLIPNEIAQHPTMSPYATTVILYLLSCKSDWTIKPKNVWKAKGLSRDQVYRAFEELIELGYMEKKETMIGNLKSSIKYRVSYLKKFVRCTEIQDTEIQDTENRYSLIKTMSEKDHSEKDNNKPPAVAAQAVVVFPVFNALEIQEDMKERLSSQMDAEKAHQLVCRVISWKGRESDAKACNTILGQWETWEDATPKEKRFEDNKQWAQVNLTPYDGRMVGIYKCLVLSNYVEFCGQGGMAQPRCFGYERKAFQAEVTALIKENLK